MEKKPPPRACRARYTASPIQARKRLTLKRAVSARCWRFIACAWEKRLDERHTCPRCPLAGAHLRVDAAPLSGREAPGIRRGNAGRLLSASPGCCPRRILLAGEVHPT